MTMRKILIGLLISLIVVMFFWFGKLIYDEDITFFIFGSYPAILFLDLLLTGAVTQIWKNVSPYRVFAISNIVIGICIALFAGHDIKNDRSFIPGLKGGLLLFSVAPYIELLLVIEFIIWLIKRPKE